MKTELIKCACGCDELFNKYDKRGRPRKFIYNHYSRIQPSKRETVNCETCGKTFKRPQWHLKRIKHIFCGHKCEGEWSTKYGRRRGKNNGHYNTITVPCSGCGTPVSKAESLIKRRNNRVYCPDCLHLAKPGKKGFYVGYPPEFNNRLRTKIRQRDNYTCRLCRKHQKKVGTLHVHHIDYDKNNNAHNNLISLCRVCHGQTNFGKKKWRKQLSAIV